jgi:ferredoxin
VGAPETAPTTALRVDWPACAGRGLCAELLPERITLDEWGFPIVMPDVPDSLRSLADEAVAACPHSALRIVHR